MIIVTGATVTLGSQIVDRLLHRLPADAIGVSVRDISKATLLADRGVRVRSGDFTDPDTLAHAFEGASSVLVISASIRGGGATEANCAAIDAAVDAGAGRIVYTSHQAASPESLFAPQLTHAATEQHLAAQRIPFTALRNGFYASTLGVYLDDALDTGRLVAPEDGPVSWTAHADLAEAAVVALTEEGTLNGITAPLTASEVLDFRAVAELLGDIAGRKMERIVVTDDEWTVAAIERGLPAPVAAFALGMFQASRRGEFDVTDPTLTTIIGHPPTSVRSVLEGLVAAR